MALVLHDTLRRERLAFEPLEPGRVRMYTCRPTVHDYAHIGNLRTFLFEDLLRRVLEARGYDVKQVMNLTDVDDKIIDKARAAGVPIEWHVRPGLGHGIDPEGLMLAAGFLQWAFENGPPGARS